jgi:hypothetical protein
MITVFHGYFLSAMIYPALKPARIWIHAWRKLAEKNVRKYGPEGI